MSETCIVCLGDLGEIVSEPPPSLLRDVLSDDVARRLLRSSSTPAARADKLEAEMIAHLLPCGHNLHNDCLKPWVERANSCPICRQSFNLVELSSEVGGPVISSYPVDNRTQIAEIDPSMLIEEFDDDLILRPCPICSDDDNEDHLLSCDGCGEEYHTYCVDLEEIPLGHWFCESCATQRAIESVCPAHPLEPQRRHNPVDRRTREQRRQVRRRNQVSSSSWARVWQSVWDRLNIDLDFPFDETSTSETDVTQRALSHRRDFRQWERRFQIAEQQGGTNRFRDTASTLLDLRAARQRHEPAEPAEPESNEEIRAWNALDKAKEIQLDHTSQGRKRKSATRSPSDVEHPPQPERPLKRPRTRRTLGLTGSSSDAQAEVSSRRRSTSRPMNPRTLESPNINPGSNGPSFLQSLLKEVESSAAPDESKGQAHLLSLFNSTGQSSPYVSSPVASPSTSNHASPRALSKTPPPAALARPGSPFSLTSKVEPIFPPPEFSPIRSPSEPPRTYRPLPEPRQPTKEFRQPRPRNQKSPASSPSRSEETSPSRASMSLSAKSAIQKVVSAALKPHYKNNAISKDEYTEINRNVSRMLYEKVGDAENTNGDAREVWERLADDEVSKAVVCLRDTK